ncbi:MAG: sulfotransferase family 2 domain-containing protein [Cyanobacteria bacterium P01_F01_bin.150]
MMDGEIVSVQNDERSAEEYLKLGNTYLKNGNLAQAEQQYLLSIDCNPNNFWGHYQLGVVYINQQKWIQAETSFKKSSLLNNRHALSYHNLGDVNLNQRNWSDAENYYCQAIALEPLYFWSHYKLGVALKEQGRIDEALASLRKAVQIQPQYPIANLLYLKLHLARRVDDSAVSAYLCVTNSDTKFDLPTSIHAKIGEYFLEKRQWHKAEQAFQRAILRSGLEIGYSKYEQQNYPESASTICKAIASFDGNREEITGAINFLVDKHVFKPTFYKINHTHKIIYCKIMKNACTLLSTVLVENSENAQEFKETNLSIHEYLESDRSHFRLKKTDFNKLLGEEYFKFVVLRNPFERIVSGYIDKFVKPEYLFESFAEPVIKEVHHWLNLDCDLADSITFSQFIDYLLRTSDNSLDAHWRPQNTFLDYGLFEFDLVIQFENMHPSLLLLEKKFGFNINKNVTRSSHITRYGDFSASEKFSDASPADLRRLNGYPSANQFYTPELEAMIRDRFADDIRIYETQFSIKIGGYH